jgi:hypothetical protein
MNCQLDERIQLEQPDKCQRTTSFDGEPEAEVLVEMRSRSGLLRELAIPESAGLVAETSLRTDGHVRERLHRQSWMMKRRELSSRPGIGD